MNSSGHAHFALPFGDSKQSDLHFIFSQGDFFIGGCLNGWYTWRTNENNLCKGDPK